MPNPNPISWLEALIDLTPPEIELIENSLEITQFNNKKYLFSEGDAARKIFIIKRGKVKLARCSADGNIFVAGIWGQDYILGLVSTYLREKRFLAGIAVGDVIAHTLERDKLISLMKDVPQFSLNIAYILARQAHASMGRSSSMMLDRVSVRICKILIKLAIPVDRHSALVLDVSQEELAQMAGASRVWVNHLLCDLDNRGLISRGKRQIKILDLERFHRHISYF